MSAGDIGMIGSERLSANFERLSIDVRGFGELALTVQHDADVGERLDDVWVSRVELVASDIEGLTVLMVGFRSPPGRVCDGAQIGVQSGAQERWIARAEQFCIGDLAEPGCLLETGL